MKFCETKIIKEFKPPTEKNANIKFLGVVEVVDFQIKIPTSKRS